MKRYEPSHFERDRFELAGGQELLQVASRHVFHHNAVHVVANELLFEPNDVWTVLALGLEFDLAFDLLTMLVVHLTKSDDFHCETFIRRSMLSQHHLAKRSIAELSDQVELVELVLKPLHVQQCLEAVFLKRFTVEVEQSRAVGRDVRLHGVENFESTLAILEVLRFGQT